MIRVYAIADGSFVVPDVRGIGGQSLSSICEGDLALLVEEDVQPTDATTDTALAFGRIVERLVQEGDVLPVRFGTSFAGRSLAAEELHSNREDWRDLLDRVVGCLELAVRVQTTEPAVPTEPSAPATSGRDYVMARLTEVRRAEALVSRVVEALGTSCRAARRLTAKGSGVELSVLVSRERADEAGDQLTAWAREQSDLSLTCSGPWAPYSFADINAFRDPQEVPS